jgi:3',5'-cyclic-nucleotide phosphodiesterase
MTPISPATNATSFLAVDSGDEGKHRISDDSAPQSEAGGPDDSSTRPSTSYASHSGDHESSSYSPAHSSGITRSEDGKDYNGALNGVTSHPQSTSTGESIKNEHSQGNGGDPNGHGMRRLPKKRSRLRLAFWKRRNHHQQEVHGES